MKGKNVTSGRKLFSIAAAALVVAWAPGASAESGVSDPGAFGILVDKNASGTKVSSFVTFAYDYELDTERALRCESQRYVRNIYIVATADKGGTIQPFNSDYISAGLQNLADCWDNQANQLFFFKNFIDQVVIPGFYKCVPGGCPTYAVKSIKNFLSTGSGGASMEVELAVK